MLNVVAKGQASVWHAPCTKDTLADRLVDPCRPRANSHVHILTRVESGTQPHVLHAELRDACITFVHV